MNRWIKRLAIAAAVIFVVIAGINDVGKYFQSVYGLDTITRAAAEKAALVAKSNPASSDSAGRTAMAYVNGHGAVLYGFEQGADRCTVWTRATVPGTIAWGPASAALSGKPITVWWSTPATVTGKAEAFIP